MELKVLSFVLVNFLPSVYAGCDSVFPGTPTFGSNCQYRCHCENDRKCSSSLPLAGGCVNGRCAHGWMGPFCQYRNIATGYVQASQQGENDHQRPELAIDGDLVTCSETNIGAFSGQQSWTVQLKRTYTIVGMKLFVKENDLGNFRDFQITTGLTSTSFPNACYKHPHAPATTLMEITCIKPVVTQYIRIILNSDNVPLRLCEVEIYGGREVSFNKQTKQSSDYGLWQSEKAVDGRYPKAGDANNTEEHMCSRTNGNENNPWWMVDLKTEFVIHDASFFGRRSTAEESAGFCLSVGNTESTEYVDIFCDDPDNNNDPSRYQPIETALSTSYMAKDVKVHLRPYSGTATLSVCELNIFAECPRNRCGMECENACYCREEVTGPMKIEGICPTGCSERWTGQNKRCDTECTKMQWGEECQNTCGNCSEIPCDIVTGHCDQGCAGPWMPPLCIKGCKSGTFGKNCEGTCGKCVNGTPCEVTTGNCMYGCDPGWQGHHCDIACEEGKYGKGCTGTCGKCIDGTTCNPHTGHCDEGCHPGFYGDRCNKECNGMQWGDECQNTCGNCMKLPCNIATGHCDQGCAGPYVPPLCVKGCKSGTFGRNCEGSCGNCLNDSPCDVTTGNCLHGCDPGWQGPICDIACQDGKYGKECTGTCGKCIDGTTCNPHTGHCDEGCHPGFYGKLCDIDANILPSIKAASTITMSSINMNWSATRAVDGSFDADPVACRCCAGTNNEKESFFKIDMPKKYPIHKIIVYGRTHEHIFHRLDGFDLILRNNTDDDGITIYDNSVMQNNICEIKLQNTLARSVEIRRPGRLTVCEVRIVEGVCQVGSFGDECKQRCHCADKGPCDRVTGKCITHICAIGFTGLACDQATTSSCSLERMEFVLCLISLTLALMYGL